MLAGCVLRSFLVDFDHKLQPEREMASAISSSVDGGAIMLDIRRYFGDSLNIGKFGVLLRFLGGDATAD